MGRAIGRVLVRPKAEQDLLDIWSYIVEQNQDDRIADRVLRQLEAHFTSILHSPGIGTAIDFLLPGIKKSIHKNYLIFYAINKNDIVIVRVLHGARDWESII